MRKKLGVETWNEATVSHLQLCYAVWGGGGRGVVGVMLWGGQCGSCCMGRGGSGGHAVWGGGAVGVMLYGEGGQWGSCCGGGGSGGHAVWGGGAVGVMLYGEGGAVGVMLTSSRT